MGRVNPHHAVSVFVTDMCTLSCQHCSQAMFRPEDAHWQWSMEDVEKWIYACEVLSHAYDFIIYTGGEPLLWENIVPATRLIRSSGITKEIRTFTNGTIPELMTGEFLGLFDQVRVSDYGHHSHIMEGLQYHYKHVKVFPIQQTPLPSQPLPHMLPANCTCDRIGIMGDKVFHCPNAYSNILRLGKRLEDYQDLWCNMDEYHSGLFIKDRYTQDICSICISNKRIRDLIIRGEYGGDTT